MSTERTTLPVTGMSCQHCVQRVKEALEEVEGVASAEVDLDGGQAVVSHAGSVTRDELAGAVKAAGYNAPARV